MIFSVFTDSLGLSSSTVSPAFAQSGIVDLVGQSRDLLVPTFGGALEKKADEPPPARLAEQVQYVLVDG